MTAIPIPPPVALVDSFIVWKTSAQGLLEGDNPGWARFTGQTREQYAGDGWLQALHPDDRAEAAERWRAAVQAGAPYEGRYRLRRHDGSYRHVACLAGPLFEGGRITAWAGVCNDITHSLQADAKRHAIEERLSFLDELGEATRHLSDPETVMSTVARLLGEHLRATRCAYADVEPDGNRFTIRNDWSAAGVDSSAGVYELERFGPQATFNLRRGQHLVVHDVDAELGDEAGGRMFNAIGIQAIICAGLVKGQRLVAMMAVHQSTPRHWTDDDIALVAEVVERCWTHIERVRDSAKLREQDRRKDEFLATLAHELRNPLAPIRYALALLRRGGDALRQQQALDVVDRQSAHLTRLVDDLLEVSRINRGLIHLQRTRIALAAVLEQAAETVAPQLQAAGHRLTLSLPAPDVLVEADATRMVQVVANLLHNAIKYTPDAGQIQLAGAVSQDQAVIEVADSGVGIPPEDQERLFDLFTQLPHTAGRAQGGLGIGLSLVKSLVDLHGGQVRVHSKGLGHGSRFIVHLPLAPGAQGASPGPEAGAEATQAGDAGHILVVEDNEDGRELLVALLEEFGHAVRAAADGPQALALARQAAPWLVLLDIGLPGMDGYEVARRLRQEAGLAHTTIVAVTGWGAPQDRERTAAAGFDAHFTKPFDPDALEHFVQQVARQRPAA
ncbi:ATP-binding protein [Aquincola tertiaricarbonis]|uniref:ATP-binding protein n=1 Tax=Aquincola tertiaricarbonis TaxID=391953 RepID=UPI000AB9A0EA|nr:ATP-binding protein [Aquincola tertiaricarbonis]